MTVLECNHCGGTRFRHIYSPEGGVWVQGYQCASCYAVQLAEPEIVPLAEEPFVLSLCGDLPEVED